MILRIGIDGGGTTTRAVVIGEALAVLGRGEAGSSNYFSVGLEGAAASIRTAINAAVSQAGIAQSEIEGYGFGLAGVVSPKEQALVGEALQPIIGDRPFVVDEDAAAAQAGAFGGEEGAIIIAGTGANCFGINASGDRARADGWGPLLGDRGSGYSIGEDTLRAVCRANDGSAPATPLLASVLAAFEVESVDALVPVVYAPEFRRDRVAALFPIVLQHAGNGDPTAVALLKNAGAELAATATAVLNKLNVKRVAPTGGVISRPSALRSAFEESLHQSIPGVSIEEPRYDAAIGAALLVGR